VDRQDGAVQGMTVNKNQDYAIGPETSTRGEISSPLVTAHVDINTLSNSIHPHKV